MLNLNYKYINHLSDRNEHNFALTWRNICYLTTIKRSILLGGAKGAHRPEFDRSRNMSFLDRPNDGPIAKLGFYTAQWIGVGRSVSQKAEPMRWYADINFLFKFGGNMILTRNTRYATVSTCILIPLAPAFNI